MPGHRVFVIARRPQADEAIPIGMHMRREIASSRFALLAMTAAALRFVQNETPIDASASRPVFFCSSLSELISGCAAERRRCSAIAVNV
jgi:hypothetical protein